MPNEKDFRTIATAAGRGFAKIAKELVDALDKARESEDTDAEDAAQRAIDEYPLSVMTRSGWHAPGDGSRFDEEYEILLGTGGPAYRLIGDLNEYGDPTSAVYQYQDWGTPWTSARLSEEESDALLRFAQVFYFGS